ncbi:MAG: hypothetical protein MRY21_06350 [Simkaniaceae bacterium]|nr:hypothetical protein [Simkaniaceae bacterium]
MTSSVSVENPITYHKGAYPQPFENGHQKVRQVVLRVIASLVIALAAAIVVVSAITILNPIIGAPIGAALLGIGIAVYILANKVHFKPNHSDLFVGPYGGLYEGDFFTAINANQSISITPSNLKKRQGGEAWQQVQHNYDAFTSSLKKTVKTGVAQAPLIPQKIHLIWLGGPIRETENKVFESWKQRHPSWEVNLWRDDEADALMDSIKEKYPVAYNAYHLPGIPMAEKADILRLVILHKHGGFYVDTDLPCISSLEGLTRHSRFFASIEHTHANPLYLCNAAIGAEKGSKIIEDALEDIQPRVAGENLMAIIDRTGPGLLSRHVRKHLLLDKKNGTNNTLVLPPAYFYPLQSQYRRHPEKAYSQSQPWTKGVHFWSSSWVPKDFL